MNLSKKNLYHIIFGTSTKAGRRFDIGLLIFVLISVILVMLESVPDIQNNYGQLFYTLEICFTLLFTFEYLLRIFISPKPKKYIFSFWGIIDLLSILPTYIGFFYHGYRYLRAIRIFRLLRAFKVLNLNQFTGESDHLSRAIKASRNKIIVFISFIITIVCCMGTIMYVVEDSKNGFTSIPQSIYWAIVTITTVGYGDIAPTTVLGKFIASLSMLVGYAIIAIPTGIVTSELHQAQKLKSPKKIKRCFKCKNQLSLKDNFCSGCGKKVK